MTSLALTIKQERRRYIRIVGYTSLPTILGGAFVGLTLANIHWSLFVLSLLLPEMVFQFIFRRLYIAAYTKSGGPPRASFYIKTVIYQLLIIGPLLTIYLKLNMN